jgi:DNA repair protein RecO (recombination protein O)
MGTLTTEAVILRARDFGEADRLLTMFTLVEGKITAKVRGARKPRSRLAGATLPLSHVEVMLWQGRSNIALLTQAVARDSYSPLRDDLHRLALASLAAELVDLMSEERIASPPTFVALLETMAMISYGEAPQLATYAFALRLLRTAGLAAPVGACAGCGRTVATADGWTWASDQAVLLCAECAGTGGFPVLPVRLDTLAALRQLSDGTTRSVAALRVDAAVARQLRAIVWDSLTAHLDRRPRSLDFLDSLPPGR